MTSSEIDSRNVSISVRKSVENLVISSQDAIGQSISQALSFSGISNSQPQETRNLSRSPSPSLRITECKQDNIVDYDNDAKSDISINVSNNGAGDVGIAVDAALVAALKPDFNKLSNPGSRSSDGSGRAKKKSWYNSLYPTYKTKSEDFRRLFKDLPDDERLIVDYSCALQRDILAHGRLYASQSHLCFYASIFGWETCLTLRWKDVTAITKEKTALVIPNAILVCTDSEKYFLTSFSGRDKAYLMLFRIWQNALMDQPLTTNEIWQWVHTCYGEELGFDSDDEGYTREPDELPQAPDTSEEAVDAASMDLDGREPRDPRGMSPPLHMWDVYILTLVNRLISKAYMRGEELTVRLEGDFLVVDKEATELWPGEFVDGIAPQIVNGDGGVAEVAGVAGVAGVGGVGGVGGLGGEGGDGRLREADALHTDMSDSSESEPERTHNGAGASCSAAHGGKVLLQGAYPFHIDQLFTMIFTNSRFHLELLALRGASDYVQAPWRPQNGVKCRQVSYRLSLTSGPIGPKEVHVSETQTMNKCSKAGYLYSIDCSSENSGIPYADYFSVEAHYCLQRAADSLTRLTIYGWVEYKKSMWPMVKAFLEKNTMSGMEEFARLLEGRLRASLAPAPPAARAARRRRRLDATSGPLPLSPAAGAAGVGAGAGAAAALPPRPAPAPRPRAWLGAALLLLLAINALLYWNLYYADRRIDFDDLQTRLSSARAEQSAEWAAQLARHTRRQRRQLLAWRDALGRTVAHLAQTEQALSKLLETIKPVLEKSESDDQTHTEL